MDKYEEIESILDYDALMDAEENTGESYKTDEATDMIGQKILEKYDDTHWNINPDNFLRIAGELGFTEIYSEDMESGDKVFIMWNYRRSILLFAETYERTKINSAYIFFNYQGRVEGLHKCSRSLIRNMICEDNRVFKGDRDVREGLRFFIEKAEQHGSFLMNWEEVPFLWLLNYEEEKDYETDFNEINKRKIAHFPEEVQKAMGIKIEEKE